MTFDRMRPLIIHLEDPAGSSRAACTGELADWPDPDQYPGVPREMCTGCTLRAQGGWLTGEANIN